MLTFTKKPQEHKNYNQYKQDIDEKKMNSIKTAKQRKVFTYDGKIEIAINLESLANTYDHKNCFRLLHGDSLKGLTNEAIRSTNPSLYSIPEVKGDVDCNIGQPGDNTFYIRRHIKDNYSCDAETPAEAAKEIEKRYLEDVSHELAKEYRKIVESGTPEQSKENIPHLQIPKDIKTTLLEPENVTELVSTQPELAYRRIIDIKLKQQ